MATSKVYISDKILDTKMPLDIVVSNRTNEIVCVYLNDFRLVGRKPLTCYEGIAFNRTFTLRDICRAIPELRKIFGLNHLGKRISDMEGTRIDFNKEKENDRRK